MSYTLIHSITIIVNTKNSNTMSNEVQFFTSILAMEPCLKERYILTIARTWNRAYCLNILDATKCRTFEEDPCIIQQTTDFCWLNRQRDLEDEVERFWKRLVKENVIKDEFLVKNP